MTSGLPIRRRPPLYGDLRRWALIRAEAIELLRSLPASSIDAVVTDPPYGIGFNDEPWDSGRLAEGEGFQAFTAWWATEIRRVLKPGGYLAALSAPRTVHRAVSGIENAGLDIRDQLLWCFATGVPKSRRMDGGLGSSLKPAYEPIILARKPLDPAARTIAANVAVHGTGGLNIDATRIPRADGADPSEGFWPANLGLVHDVDCAPERGECMPDCAVPLIDRIAAQERSPGAPPFSRLFYAAKASRGEREAGLERLQPELRSIFSGTLAKARANVHPTVKPLSLMRWVVRLVVPPGGLVLDPFAGSGSTGIAAVLEGRQFLGVEKSAEYCEVARYRIAHGAGSSDTERVS